MTRTITRKSERATTSRTPSRSSRPSSRTRQTSGDLPTRKPGKGKKKRSWLFYGRAGTGKSTLASTFPGKVLFLDIRDEGDDSYSDVEGVEVRDITSWEELEDTYWWLKQNPGVYSTVVWDTVTQAQQLLVEEIGERKKLKKGKVAGDWGTMTKQDWGDVASQLKTWITNYRDLPMEVVFLAQDRVFNMDDDEGSAEGVIDPEVGPRLSPSVKSHLCAAVSVIGSTFIRRREVVKKVEGKTRRKEVIEYCLRLGPSASYITKIRKAKSVDLPNFIADPSFEEILEIIQQGD